MPDRMPEQVGPFQLVIVVLSVYVLVAMFVQSVTALPPDVDLLLRRIDDAICVVFLADFFIRFAKAESKLRFLRWGWIDFVSSLPAIEFLRWGRVVRVMRIFRILRALRSTRVLVQYFFRNRAHGVFATVALISFTLTIFASIAILNVEVAPQSNIRTAEDALWWSVTTMTTVGYGDRYPVTPAGRVIAVVLMTAGVALFGTFTGLVASYFMEPEQQEETSELRALADEVHALRAQLEAMQRETLAIQRETKL
jgi:voltage-gated potassium channel